MDIGWLLVMTLLLPLVGAALVWVLAPLGDQPVRWAALGATLLALVGASCVVFSPEALDGGEFAVVRFSWLDPSGGAPLGLDGLGIWMFWLSAVLTVTSVLVSWKAIDDGVALFYGLLLLLEFGCLGVFAARDIILFYVCFEFTLIPLFFLIGIWGSEQRRYAAMKFFVYTLAGSVLTFLGLLAIVLWHAARAGSGSLTFSIPVLTDALSQAAANKTLSVQFQLVVFLALLAGFAIKVPVFPFHTWLPLAHVQAPTAGSVILAGILLKIGTYGFLRFSIPMLPDATVICMPLLLWLAVMGILYGALVALAQRDIKKLIAYSSVSHLGYCMLGIFALNRVGVQGGTLQMLNHGISTGALFALVGMLYERYHTREIAQLGGVARRTPWLAFFMLLFTLASVGLPGLNGFAGEVLVLIGMFQRAWTDSPSAWQLQYVCVAVLALSGVVLGAWYMLWLVQRVFFGLLREPHEGDGGDSRHAVRDLSGREILALAPLGALVVWIGLQPGFFLSRMDATLDGVTAMAQESLHRMSQPAERTALNTPLVRGELPSAR